MVTAACTLRGSAHGPQSLAKPPPQARFFKRQAGPHTGPRQTSRFPRRIWDCAGLSRATTTRRTRESPGALAWRSRDARGFSGNRETVTSAADAGGELHGADNTASGRRSSWLIRCLCSPGRYPSRRCYRTVCRPPWRRKQDRDDTPPQAEPQHSSTSHETSILMPFPFR